MVATRRQTASAATSENTSDSKAAGGLDAVTSKLTVGKTRASKRALPSVAEVDNVNTTRRSRARRASEPCITSPPAAATIAEPDEHVHENEEVADDEASAYDTLLNSIFEGFQDTAAAAGDDEEGWGSAGDGERADGERDDEDSDDEDSDDAGDSGDDGGDAARASGGSSRNVARSARGRGGAVGGAGGEGADAEVGEGDGIGVLAWQPEIAMPEALSAGATKTLLAKEKGLAKLVQAPPRDPRKAARDAAKRREDTAGDGWFGMKAQPITDQVKQDWRLLRLRAAYNPRHFYKSFDTTKIPKYFQMGEVVEGSGEFYSSRMTKKERKQTLTEELLADLALKRERVKRYNKMQEANTKWSKMRKKNHPKMKRSAPKQKR